MAILSANKVSVRYPGQARPALSEVSLDIGPDDLTVALGPSGCGKTTLLNLFAGFVQPDGGELRFGDAPVTGPGADRAVVFQHDALLPWLNVRDNVAFGLRLQGVAKPERLARADEVLRLVDLPDAGSRYSWQLSGGQRQRVGIARALASHSQVLLKVWQQARRRIFLITHDIEEALFLATELVLMSPGPGRIVETLRPGFSQRYRAGESARAIKSDPAFIALREQLLATLFDHRRQAEEIAA